MNQPPEHIPLQDLKHGAYYRGRCRNATVARWNAENQIFVYWRTKFSFRFLEEIKPPELDDVYDVFYAVEEITDITNHDEISLDKGKRYE